MCGSEEAPETLEIDGTILPADFTLNAPFILFVIIIAFVTALNLIFALYFFIASILFDRSFACSSASPATIQGWLRRRLAVHLKM